MYPSKHAISRPIIKHFWWLQRKCQLVDLHQMKTTNETAFFLLTRANLGSKKQLYNLQRLSQILCNLLVRHIHAQKVEPISSIQGG